jgi:hypothetical protein
MLRSLWRVRKAGQRLFPVQSKSWIFPAQSRSGHLIEHKQKRTQLSRWAGDLRQTYRTTAQSIKIPELDVRLLLNHAISDVSGGYVTREKLLSSNLRHAQERLSHHLTYCSRARLDENGCPAPIEEQTT